MILSRRRPFLWLVGLSLFGLVLLLPHDQSLDAQLPTRAVALGDGFQGLTHSGPDASVDEFLGLFVEPTAIEAIFRWSTPTQQWESWIRGLPGPLQSVQQVSQNTPLLLRLNRPTTYVAPQQSYAAGTWDVDPAFSALATPDVISAVFRFNNETKGWDVFNPLLPPSLNSLQTLNQFDALLVRVTSSVNWPFGAFDPGVEEAGARLQVALLTEISGPLAELVIGVQRGAELARDHVNSAGGVNGSDMVLVLADLGAGDPVGTTRAIVDAAPVSALIGPLRSVHVREVFAAVAEPEGLPLITPAGTAPDLTDLDAADLLFRTVPADAVYLAYLLNTAGVEQVAIFYDESSSPIADALQDNFDGTVTRVAYTPGGASYAVEIAEVAAGGAVAFVAIGTPDDARVFLPDALALGQFTHFFFDAELRDDSLFADLADPALNGARGVSSPAGASQAAFDAAYVAAFGEEPGVFSRESYDAVIALAFAAERADATDGIAIRDALRAVTGPPGTVVVAGAAGIADGLARIRAGETVNYEGAASSVDWDANGDIDPAPEIWEVQEGMIVTLAP